MHEIKEHKPLLTKKHKEARFSFASERVLWTVEWKSVMVSDKKKINSDGHDKLKYYWIHNSVEKLLQC